MMVVHQKSNKNLLFLLYFKKKFTKVISSPNVKKTNLLFEKKVKRRKKNTQSSFDFLL